MASNRRSKSKHVKPDIGVKFQAERGVLTRAAVLHPSLPVKSRRGAQTSRARGHVPVRDPESCLDEAVGLARAIDLEIAFFENVPIRRPKSATLFGSGKVDEFGARIAAEDIDLVVVDGSLSPVQQRNLERAWNTKVLDRTGLILEIFGRRASTKEGRLQVELAHLTYQKSRLVRSWTHLERQRGGLGFIGGPGETQIEADRRLIQERINSLEKQLEKVRRTRYLHRASRKKVPFPMIALVGYTNAGKSTLFNVLTSSKVPVRDQLFATLDPTMRAIALPEGATAILSDTVGFISDLPTHLVAAFRATLEEVLEADLILHVRDIAHKDTAAQALDVRDVLRVLNVDEKRLGEIVEIWNKIDLLDRRSREIIEAQAKRRDNVVAVCAVTGAHMDTLLAVAGARLDTLGDVVTVEIETKKGGDIHWLYENCRVLDRQDRDDGTGVFQVRVPAVRQRKFRQLFPDSATLAGAAQ